MSDNRIDNHESTEDPLYELLKAIQSRTRFDHDIEKFELIETHISYILLTGQFAYKFKKHLNLGFLDFSTLARRKRYCEEEVRLNRRTAPEIYIAVVAITGTRELPVIDGNAKVLEYAVKMRQFTKKSELNHVLEEGKLKPEHVDSLARQIAAFHKTATVIPLYHPSGSTYRIETQCEKNFVHIRNFLNNYADEYTKLDHVHEWTNAQYRQIYWHFIARKHRDCIRDCHGDLHLRNIILMNGQLRPFDCLEFSDDLRQIDVISDVAFLLMDLEARGYSSIAWRFLNSYLQATGDYAGVLLLRFYKVYRALVRVKVACIRLQQSGLSMREKDRQWLDLRLHLELAFEYTNKQQPVLIITHGLSGSGKTMISQQLMEEFGAIRIRSDVERKRLNNIPEHASTNAKPGKGLYAENVSRHTYGYIADMAEKILDDGYSVIVDATFLQLVQRNQFQSMAAKSACPFVILDLKADHANLRRRIKERLNSGADVSEADLKVLNYQIASEEPLNISESARQVVVDTEGKVEIANVIRQIKRKTRLDSTVVNAKSHVNQITDENV